MFSKFFRWKISPTIRLTTLSISLIVLIVFDPYIKTPYCTIGHMYVINAFIICDSPKAFLSSYEIEQFDKSFVTTSFECFEKRNSLSIVMPRYLKLCFSSISVFFMNVLDTTFCWFFFPKSMLFVFSLFSVSLFFMSQSLTLCSALLWSSSTFDAELLLFTTMSLAYKITFDFFWEKLKSLM